MLKCESLFIGFIKLKNHFAFFFFIIDHDYYGSDVMAPMPVGHPDFIKFTEEVQIGRPARDVGR